MDAVKIHRKQLRLFGKARSMTVRQKRINNLDRKKHLTTSK